MRNLRLPKPDLRLLIALCAFVVCSTSARAADECSAVPFEAETEAVIPGNLASNFAEFESQEQAVVRGALIARPENTALIVQETLNAGHELPTVSGQCDCGLGASQLVSLVAATVQSRPGSLPTMRNCVVQIPPEQMTNMVIEALRGMEQERWPPFMSQVNAMFASMGLEGEQILVSSLVDGEFLISEDIGDACVGDCLTTFAEEVVSDALEGINAPDSEVDEFEPPLSDF